MPREIQSVRMDFYKLSDDMNKKIQEDRILIGKMDHRFVREN
jgi:hypothetical protein